MRVGRSIAISLALLASACAPDSEVDTNNARDTTTVPELESTTLQTFTDIGTIPDPTTTDVIYTCGETTLELSQLVQLDDLPRPDETLFAEMTDWFDFGTADRWAMMRNGYAVDTTPLQSNPPSLVYVNTREEWGPNFCVPVTQNWGHTPTSWRVESVAGTSAVLAVENCVDPSKAIDDIRPFDGDLIVWVYANRTSRRSCVVDGSTTLEVEIPADSTGILLSGYTWPPTEPNPATWFRTQNTPPLTEVTEADLAAITCVAESQINSVYVRWLNIPAGVGGQVLADGTVQADFEPSNDQAGFSPEPFFSNRMIEYGNPTETWETPYDPIDDGSERHGGISLFGDAKPIQRYEIQVSAVGANRAIDCGEAGTLTDVPAPECSLALVGGFPSFVFEDPHQLYTPGLTQVIRDGEPIDLGIQFGGPIDTTAIPGVTYTYQLQFADLFDNQILATSDCGSITIPTSSSPAEEIESARILFERVGVGPFLYMTVRTGSTEHHLATTLGKGAVREFLPADVETEPFNPFTIHERLAQAIESGDEVTFEFNAASGLPTSWTIDRVERGFVCVHFDTRSPEHQDIACDSDFNLIR